MRLSALVILYSVNTFVLAATPVTTQPLAQLLIHPEFSAPAHVQSLNDSRLSSELTARIDNIRVRVGDQVKSGDPLVELDCRDYQSQLSSQQVMLNELEAQQELAQSQLKRARLLEKRNNIGEEQVEQRATEVSVLRARRAFQQERIRQSELAVERCQIRAPFAGVVTERLAQAGELATPGTPLLRLRQLDLLEISASLRVDQEPPVNGGVVFEYQDRRYPLTLRRLLPVIESRARTREARFEFAAELAPPGAAGRVIWRDGADYIPAYLLVRRQLDNQSELGLILLDGEQARFHPLPGAIEGQAARVDLDRLQLVIVDGRQSLRDGDAVSVQLPAHEAEDGAGDN